MQEDLKEARVLGDDPAPDAVPDPVQVVVPGPVQVAAAHRVYHHLFLRQPDCTRSFL